MKRRKEERKEERHDHKRQGAHKPCGLRHRKMSSAWKVGHNTHTQSNLQRKQFLQQKQSAAVPNGRQRLAR
jgi:hypothetical protein